MSKQIHIHFGNFCVDILLLDNDILQASFIGLPYDSYKLVADSRLDIQLGTSLCSYYLDESQVHSFREQHQFYVDGKSHD